MLPRSGYRLKKIHLSTRGWGIGPNPNFYVRIFHNWEGVVYLKNNESQFLAKNKFFGQMPLLVKNHNLCHIDLFFLYRNAIFANTIGLEGCVCDFKTFPT